MRRDQDTDKHREGYSGTQGEEAHVCKPRRKVSGNRPCNALVWACSIMLVQAITKGAARESDSPHTTSPSQHPTGLLLSPPAWLQSLPLWEEASQRASRMRASWSAAWGAAGLRVHLELGHGHRRGYEAKLTERMSIQNACPLFYDL